MIYASSSVAFLSSWPNWYFPCYPQKLAMNLRIVFDLGITDSNSLRSSTNEMLSLRYWDKAIYSFSVVHKAIMLCSLEHHIMGQFPYFIKYPVLDIIELGSSLHTKFQSSAKEVSTQTSRLFSNIDENFIPIQYFLGSVSASKFFLQLVRVIF